MDAIQLQLEGATGQVNILQDGIHFRDTVITGKDAIIETQNNIIEAGNATQNQMAISINNQLQTINAKDYRHHVWARTHSFVMLRTNNPHSKRPYYAIRRKSYDMPTTIRKMRTRHPNSQIIYRSDNVPNPVNLYDRLKATDSLMFERNYCSSMVPEAELVKTIHCCLADSCYT